MKQRSLLLTLAVLAAAASLAAQSNTGHPDLSGTWLFSIDLPPIALKRQTNGSTSVKGIDASGRRPAAVNVPGALPYTAEPAYKPELRAKVKDLLDHESRTDQVFYCGRPGVPRIGPPRRIIQMPNEVVFLYEDISGDPYRIIPTDGRPHKKDGNPSYYGDSVGRWEGSALVVDVTNFVEDTWFGEDGYFHSDAMHVTERFWRSGVSLVYQVTVDDPKVLTAPWTMAPRVVKPSTEPLEESPRCVEADSKLLVNDDHHGQR
jgi:hypothetical protein